MSYYFVPSEHDLQLKIMYIGSHSVQSDAQQIQEWCKESKKCRIVSSGGHLAPTVIEFKDFDTKNLFILTWYNGKNYSLYGDFKL